MENSEDDELADTPDKAAGAKRPAKSGPSSSATVPLVAAHHKGEHLAQLQWSDHRKGSWTSPLAHLLWTAVAKRPSKSGRRAPAGCAAQGCSCSDTLCSLLACKLPVLVASSPELLQQACGHYSSCS